MEFISVSGASNVGSQPTFTSFEFTFESKRNHFVNLTLFCVVPTLAKQETFDEVWERIEKSGVFSAEKGQGISKEAAFRDVNKLCKLGKAALLSERVENRIKDLVITRLQEMRDNAGEFE